MPVVNNSNRCTTPIYHAGYIGKSKVVALPLCANATASP